MNGNIYHKFVLFVPISDFRLYKYAVNNTANCANSEIVMQTRKKRAILSNIDLCVGLCTKLEH